MPAPYTPLAVANYFIERFGAPNGIEHMKLQKLVYCAYGWWLALDDTGTRLLNEGPQVWRHGPVFDSLYHVLKPFGRRPITEIQSVSPFARPDQIDADDDNTRFLLDWTWNRYGHLSSFALSNMTHKAGTPWNRVATEHDFRVPFGLEIPDEYIKEEFSRIYTGEFKGSDDNHQRAARA